MRLLADIAVRARILDDAEFILESAVEFEPEHRNARIQYANILMRTQKFAMAWEQAQLLMQKYPDDIEAVKSLYASSAMGVGENTIDIANASRKIKEAEVQACAEAGVADIIEVISEAFILLWI